MTGDVVELTMDEAVAVKKRHMDEGVRDLGKQWYTTTMATPEDAVRWLNTPPAQGPGEGWTTSRPDGRVQVYYWYYSFS